MIILLARFFVLLAWFLFAITAMAFSLMCLGERDKWGAGIGGICSVVAGLGLLAQIYVIVY